MSLQVLFALNTPPIPAYSDTVACFLALTFSSGSNSVLPQTQLSNSAPCGGGLRTGRVAARMDAQSFGVIKHAAKAPALQARVLRWLFWGAACSCSGACSPLCALILRQPTGCLFAAYGASNGALERAVEAALGALAVLGPVGGLLGRTAGRQEQVTEELQAALLFLRN